MALDEELETNAGDVGFIIIIFVDSPPSSLYSPPLSQIWTFTETDFMPGLPVNSLNSIVGPLSAPGCNELFPQPQGGQGVGASPFCRWGPQEWES